MTANAIHHYVTLTRSPLLLAPIIESFFQNIKPFEKNILLGYLVLPIVLYRASRNFLQSATSRSTLITFCKKNNHLSGLPQRLEELRSTCSLAVQNSIDCARLIIHPDLSLEYVGNNQYNSNQIMSAEIKAAKRLAIIFQPYEVSTVYKLLGVTNL
ncbi:three component ABC system middle component [Legionella sp.]|uniref:three component ABC system middle component n=1 Tax=Legionella sp. TaxID=459 RepID=UPI003CA05B00